MKFHALCLFVTMAVTAQAADKLRVVTFSTILTEIATRVGGDRVDVIGLVAPGADPHEYAPTPDDLRLVDRAQLILLSAKHMEAYVGKLKESTGTAGDLVEVGDHFPSLRLHTAEGGEERTIEDPHWWHSPQNMRRATRVVCDELCRLDPAAADGYRQRAEAYGAELDELDRWARVELARLPRAQRKLVTSHDAFQYFARDYAFTVDPIEGVSTDEQPSSKHVAELIGTIRQEKVRAIFLEDKLNPKVSTEITKESGAEIGGTLYADGLTTGDGSTYAGMFRHNVTTMVQGLAGR